MSKALCVNREPFFLNGKRAMVSLGPFTERHHCPYRCAFCYVQDEFGSYATLAEDDIIKFLKNKRGQYQIIYVSGDTDSFAPPRTKQGLSLLFRIASEIECDLLFTTRTVFSEEDYETLHNIVELQKKAGKEIYACVSISRYSDSVSYLEPNPIPCPDNRIGTLEKLKRVGATTVLAMRPFLPVVCLDDYLTILEKSKDFVDIALGESFFFIRDGMIQNRVFPNGISSDIENQLLANQKMRFDNNNANWMIWDSAEYIHAIRNKCDEYGIVFSMHSDEAITDYLYKKRGLF